MVVYIFKLDGTCNTVYKLYSAVMCWTRV